MVKGKAGADRHTDSQTWQYLSDGDSLAHAHSLKYCRTPDIHPIYNMAKACYLPSVTPPVRQYEVGGTINILSFSEQMTEILIGK